MLPCFHSKVSGRTLKNFRNNDILSSLFNETSANSNPGQPRNKKGDAWGDREDSFVAGLALAMKLGTFTLSLPPKWPDSVTALCYPVSTKVTLPKVWMSISFFHCCSQCAEACLMGSKLGVCKKSGLTCNPWSLKGVGSWGFISGSSIQQRLQLTQIRWQIPCKHFF